MKGKPLVWGGILRKDKPNVRGIESGMLEDVQTLETGSHGFVSKQDIDRESGHALSRL